jgi:hypothetical protein
MLKNFFLLVFIVALVGSCSKSTSPVGIGILPQADLIGGAYMEFIPDVSYSEFKRSDSVLLTTRLSNASLLGSINDPIFGRTDASIYCSFETPYSTGGIGSTLDLGTNPELDSAVLILSYDYVPNTTTIFAGDTTDPLSIDIFPLKENLNPDTNYYSTGNNYYNTNAGVHTNGPIPYDANTSLIYGGKSKFFYPSLSTFPPIKKDTVAGLNNLPQLRVRLRSDFAEGLFPTITNNTAFQEYLKGIFITTKHSIMLQPSYGSIFFVYMDNNSSITFYFHNQGSTTQTVLPFYCNGSTCNRFSYFRHDYSIASPDLQHQINSKNSDTTTINNPNNKANHNVYVQGTGGVGVVLKFPKLLQLADCNIVINKAELVLKTDMSNMDFYNLNMFPLPGRLYLEGDTLGGPAGLVENLYTFGGYYDLTNNQYLIEVPHTIGLIVNRRTLNTKYYLTVYNGGLFPERVVLGGTANNTYPIKLKIWYTRLTTKK